MQVEIGEMRFCTIREAARLLGLSHDRLRCWQKAGQLPGFYSGSRYMVNFPRLVEALESGQIGARPQGGGEQAQNEDGVAARG